MIIPRLEVDPCGRAQALNDVRTQLLTGGLREIVEFESADGSRSRVQYGKASIDGIMTLIHEAEHACAILKGKRSTRRRRAYTGGM